jgi:hypothetical protein
LCVGVGIKKTLKITYVANEIVRMGGIEKKVKIETKWAEPFIVSEYPGPTGDGDENLCRVPHVGYYELAKKVMLVLSLGPFMSIQ